VQRKCPPWALNILILRKVLHNILCKNDSAEYKRFQKTCQEEIGNFFAKLISFLLVLAAAESTKEKFFTNN
jgi:hypothetical protein